MLGSSSSFFERHLQTAIQMILVALLCWAGSKLVDLIEANARLQEKLTYQGDQIASLNKDLRDWSSTYYLKSTAEREFGAVHDDLMRLAERVTTLEGNRRNP